MAENYTFQSPYVYAANNPIRFIEFMGMSAQEGQDTDEYIKGPYGIKLHKIFTGSHSGITYDSDGDPIIRMVHYNSPPGMSGGGGSRKRGEVNDELPVEEGNENYQSTIDNFSWDEISDKLIPVAYSVELNIGKEAGSAASTSPNGLIFVFRGPDRFKVSGFTSVGVGGGWLSVSATAHSIYYFYYGDIKNFDLTVFEGTAIDFEVTAGKGLVGGGIITVTPNSKTPGEYLIGIGAVAGFGAGSPVSGSSTWQQTKLWW